MDLVRCSDPAAAMRFCREHQAAGETLGLVPTMGALHEGHLGLVRCAAAENDLAVVSIFVNPLQFDDPGDLERYPRDFEADAALLAGVGAAMAFTGTLAGFFPGAVDPDTIEFADPGPAAVGFEGAHRLGHFDGVATIVRRLFQLVRPARAYFGEKDFQQSLVVRHVAERMEDGPEVRVCATSRDPDGMARSSRNSLLDSLARERGRALSRGLFRARDAWRAGERRADVLERVLAAELDGEGLEVEYAVVLDPRGGGLKDGPSGASVCLTAARALVAVKVWGRGGRSSAVRLIDNLSLSEDGAP